MHFSKYISYRCIIQTILVFLVFSGCSIPLEQPEIIYPSDGAVFIEGTTINCMADCEGSWICNGSMSLGIGSSISFIPESGDYNIIFTDINNNTDEIIISVLPATLEIGKTVFLSATEKGTDRKIGSGNFQSFVYSSADSTVQVNLVMNNDSFGTGVCDFSENTDVISGRIPRPPVFTVDRNLLQVAGQLAEKGLAEKGLAEKADIGDVRSFRMANPETGTSAPGFEILATLAGKTEGCEIWLDNDSVADHALFNEFAYCLASVALPRAKAIWGQQYDRNGDGCFSVLVSSKLNDGGAAIGFFNPCDFLPYDNDSASSGYNPTSNEMDMVYTGIPENPETSPAYSPKAIAATVAHEYQHLVRFGCKTYIPLLAGDENAEQEDTAFDEGMAHLTESLVGYGCSGGNALFAGMYLNNPGNYSIKNYDLNGASDSAGKRGGSALFFYWLLEKAGGLAWDNAEPLVPDVDSGDGLAFLQATLAYNDSGWGLVEDYFGESLASLYREYLIKENRIIAGLDPHADTVIDSITCEPVSLHSYIGDFSFGENTYSLNGPVTVPYSPAMVVPSFGTRYLEGFAGADGFSVSIQSNSGVSGSVFWGVTGY